MRDSYPGNDSYFYQQVTANYHLMGSSKNGNGALRKIGFAIGYTDSESDVKMTVSPNGNVGIGHIEPSSKLHIQALNSAALKIEGENSNVFGFEIGGSTFGLYDYTQSKYQLRTNNGDLILLEAGGNVGIGTTDPGNFKVAVEGKIVASEVVVTFERPWPDYVFDKDYALVPLSELERFIKVNNHLPDVPSSEEIEKNGLALGE